MTEATSQADTRRFREYHFVLVGSVAALALTSIPYLVGAVLATDERIFGGFVYAVEDCYSYLAKMRQGAQGAWLFHIAYTPEPHPGALFFPFHLLLGKIAALLPGRDLTSSMIWTYHVARWIFGFALLLTVYRFLAAFTERVVVRRLAWLMVAFGGGLGWLLIALGRSGWLGSMPLDFILPEGFTFLVLYAFPHIALGRTLLLLSLLSLCKVWQLGSGQDDSKGRPLGFHRSAVRWAALTGVLWLLIGLIVPFYVAVAWAITGAGWIAFSLRERQLLWRKALLAGLAAVISTPIVLYSAWRFTSHPVYAAWASQNQILSPHPLHYLAAYGVLLSLAAFAVRDAWRSGSPTWLMLAWIGVVPLLIYLPFNLQRRLVEGVQVPLSLLAAIGLVKIAGLTSQAPSPRTKLVLGIVLIALFPTNVILIAGNTLALRGLPSPIFHNAEKVAALDWLGPRVEPNDVVLASYETGNYLPARVGARSFVGHGPESVRASQKRALVAQFFDATTEDTWRRRLLREYQVDYVLWGPEERSLGAFNASEADYLRPLYERHGYVLFEVAS